MLLEWNKDVIRQGEILDFTGIGKCLVTCRMDTFLEGPQFRSIDSLWPGIHLGCVQYMQIQRTVISIQIGQQKEALTALARQTRLPKGQWTEHEMQGS